MHFDLLLCCWNGLSCSDYFFYRPLLVVGGFALLIKCLPRRGFKPLIEVLCLQVGASLKLSQPKRESPNKTILNVWCFSQKVQKNLRAQILEMLLLLLSVELFENRWVFVVCTVFNSTTTTTLWTNCAQSLLRFVTSWTNCFYPCYC